ncbi:HAMP domain-containing sensor histidine kinase [Massilia terrae]|uniref:histidine kinase n=1 Tax=Massilia terrae TaxID=1811224 RepID=A0ABT2CX80_9BURK|nr:HAMP domain-containing sensor histidine kinase [Massilia terrae]MCS0658590.1 HAMP domain-containing histidine kinase [Massilia terrae]
MEDQSRAHELFLFLASTAHDMKNSISILSGTLEQLLVDAPQAAPAYPRMAHMLHQTRRLNNQLMQLLALYKQVGTPEYPFDMQPLEVGELAEQVAASERVLLQSRGVTLEIDCDPHLVWHFDEDLIIGVMSHAIHNATNYTRDRILLVIREVDGFLELRLEDNGMGYPQSMLDAGVAAMHGASNGVNFLTNSAGLGLYFSSEVAKMHRHRGRHGDLRLENGGRYGGGCFILRLP